jgi:hypothetical protein
MSYNLSDEQKFSAVSMLCEGGSIPGGGTF